MKHRIRVSTKDTFSAYSDNFFLSDCIPELLTMRPNLIPITKCIHVVIGKYYKKETKMECVSFNLDTVNSYTVEELE